MDESEFLAFQGCVYDDALATSGEVDADKIPHSTSNRD